MSIVCGPVETGQEGRQLPIWETPMEHGADLVRKLLDAGWPEGVVINVNYPSCEPAAVKGMVATVQGLRDPGFLRIEDRLDTRGRAYYWVGIEPRRVKPREGTDLWAVRSNFISITPLCLDYTDQRTRDRFAEVFDSPQEAPKAQPAEAEMPAEEDRTPEQAPAGRHSRA
jgi:5'-nucleotidase